MNAGPACRFPRRHLRGFTFHELLVATAVLTLVVGAFAVFLRATGVSIVNVTNQSTFNQEAGHATEFIISRIRLANTASNAASGDLLTLSFDDNPDADSNGDKLTWNDLDHFEQFRFEPTDGNADTLENNRITYQAAPGAGFKPLIQGGVRRLPGQPVFSITNQASVLVRFGLLYTNENVRSQAIEIMTEGRLRNRIE